MNVIRGLDMKTIHKGFSLVEVLVALFIGSLLILGAMQLYLNVFRGDKTNSKLATMQENGRLLAELMARHARRAGYQGCISSTNEIKFTNSKTKLDVVYPKDAVKALLENGKKGVRFSYAAVDSGKTLDPDGTYPYRDCRDLRLGEYYIEFINAINNKNEQVIMINSPETGRREELVKNATFDIRYVEFNCDSGLDYCYRDKPDEKTRKIEIDIELFDPDNQVAKKHFVSSVKLRNRFKQ